MSKTIQERLRSYTSTWNTTPNILIREAAHELDRQAARIDAQATENERLRALVADAYDEAFDNGQAHERWDSFLDEKLDWWMRSKTRAALNLEGDK